MTDLSNAQLSGQMSALLVSWQAREDQYRAWTGGTANGGPNADGRYQLTDSAGITRLVECPALLASTVSGPAAAALAHKLETIVARDVSISEATRAAAQRVLSEAALAAAVLARNQAQLARDQAQNSESNAAVHAGTASVAASSSTAAYLGTQADREATTADAAAADADRILAQAAATAAAADRAAINPVQFATRADGLSQIVGLQAALDAKLPLASFTWSGLAGKPSTFAPSAHSHVIADTTGLQAALDAKLATSSFTWSSLPGKPTEFAVAAHVHDASAITSGVFDIDRIPILPSQVQQMSSGDLTALTAPQQTAIKSGTIVTTTDGSRYVYSGTGSKTSAASYVLLADVTPDWNTISGKPSTFAPSAHSHVIADTTGLQAALDGKQAAGSYSLTSHVHDWSVITGKPSTFAPSAHSHIISDVTGLQSALDATVKHKDGTRVDGLDLNTLLSSGFHNTGASTVNGPGSADYSQVIVARGIDTGLQIVGGYNGALRHRGWHSSGNTFLAWRTLWDNENFNPASKLDTSEVSVAGTANTVVRRDASGYITGNWFNTTGGLYTSSTGAHFITGASGWTARSGSASSSMLMLQTSEGIDRGRIYVDNANVIGFLNNDGNWALQLQKTGPSFLRVNNVLRSIWTSDDMAVHSSRDFVNGTLVTTDLSYPVSSGEAFIMEIRGNGYGSSLPFDTVVQGYLYNNTLIAVSGISNGAHITGMVAFGVGGKLCFWWPRQAYWQGFNVKVYFAQAGEAARNRVMSITDVVKPSGTAEVDITANVVASWTSGNFNPDTKFNTAGGTLTGSISTTHGADRSLTLASSTNYSYQLITAGDHFHIREASDAAKVRLSISYPNGNVGIGRTGATSRLQVEYANPVSVPAAGATGHAFAAGTSGYGLAAGVLTSGNAYLQSTRWDGGATNYPLMLQPNGGATRVGDDLQFDKVRSGMVGVYDAAQTQAIFAMGPSYTLTPGGASNQIGGLYGLAWSYNPDYGGSGNNPQSKAGLNHQLLLMQNGVTTFAAGSGIWTSGGLTVGGGTNLNGDLTAAQGSVYTSGGLIYSTNWWRSTGQTGWYNATYGTGIWSIVAGEVRTYNGSKFHSEGDLSSGGVVQSGTEGGFRNAGYVSGRNRIWSFANADSYGLSYYQGSGGWSGMDTINFHFGNTAEGSSMHKFRSDGVAAHAGDLYVKGTRLPVFTSSTGSPSGGVDGDIHITY